MSLVISNEIKRKYVYPMANATNGGESHTEYNVRSALNNILSYSAAFSMSDFKVDCQYNDTDIPNQPVLHLWVSRGRGNCNAYYVNCGELGTQSHPEIIPFNFRNIPIKKDALEQTTATIGSTKDITVTFGLYVCVDYTQTIADNVTYKFITNKVVDNDKSSTNTYDTEYEEIYKKYYEPQGFNDIGILLGTMKLIKNGDNESWTGFVENPDKTKCIDIYRLGSEDGIEDTLAKLIKRLKVLNIFGGDFYISNTILDGNDIGSDGATDYYGGDYRLKIHEDITKTSNGKNKISGSMSLVRTNVGGQDDLIQHLFTFETNEFTNDADLSDIHITSITFNPDVIFTNIKANKGTFDSITTNSLNVTGKSIFNDSITLTEPNNPDNKCVITFAKVGNENTINIGDTNNPVSVKANKVYGAVWM